MGRSGGWGGNLDYAKISNITLIFKFKNSNKRSKKEQTEGVDEGTISRNREIHYSQAGYT